MRHMACWIGFLLLIASASAMRSQARLKTQAGAAGTETPLVTSATRSGSADPSPGTNRDPQVTLGLKSKLPPEYKVAAETESGRRLVAHKTGARTVPAALQSVLLDLSGQFDARPLAHGAFIDSRNRRWGGMQFEAAVKGRPLKGLILCSMGEAGADVAVAYCRADAPPSEWAKLQGEVAGSPTGSVRSMREHRFPDGTGSVLLPDGWQTTAQTAIHGVHIRGPAGQLVTIGQSVSVCTPDSIAVQTQLSLEAQARQMGFPPPKPMEILVAPFTGPVEAVENLLPQLSKMSQRKGGPALRLEKILEPPVPVKANLPNGRAASLCYSITRTTQGRPVLYRCRAELETWLIGQGAWSIIWTELAAPDMTFDRDLPVMSAIVQSFKTDPGAMQRETGRAIAAANQRFAAYQRAHATQVQAFDDYFQSQQRNSLIRDRVAIDFDEVIRGVRTVEDARTGERHSVDLGNVKEIVDELNRPEPGRFIEIPLRDELAPLPGQP